MGKNSKVEGVRVEGARHLVMVFGDQLNSDSAAFDGFDPEQDAVLMIEAEEEASFVPQHKHRLVLFFSAMRHFRDQLRAQGRTVHYAALDDAKTEKSFGDEIPRWLEATGAERLIMAQPGDYRVRAQVRGALRDLDCRLEIRQDRHFLCSTEEFEEFAAGRGRFKMETFYRHTRRRHQMLLTEQGEPVGGRWNFDHDNRKSFGKGGVPEIKAPRSFRWDEITEAVAQLVDKRFADSPGRTENFDYPVTSSQARAALGDFVDHRLADFGQYQDAMVVDRPYLFHSRLSSSLNLHLLDPRETIDKVLEAYAEKDLPLNSVEGFVRQVLGWREYVRGIYWREMPDYENRNALEADLPMPSFMWTGKTEMRCVSNSVEQLVEHAYAHHIQRLMVLGLFALLLGVRPREVNGWHHSMYIDAIDWVSLPNVLGMSQYGDGGLLATKPYCASGAYIQRMGNYCEGCRYDPKKSTGDDACPFTTLYWDFLSRNRNRLQGNHRMNFQFANLDRKDSSERRAVRRRADYLKSRLAH